MDVNMSLDEIIAKNKGSFQFHTKNPRNNNEHNLHKIQHKTIFKQSVQRIGDARNKIVARNRAKIVDARDILLRNTRRMGFDARQRITEQHKQLPEDRCDVKKGRSLPKERLGNRIITCGHDPGGIVELPKRKPPSSSSTRTFFTYGNSEDGIKKPIGLKRTVEVPRGYVDYDNMQEQEQEEYRRAVFLNTPKKSSAYVSDYSSSISLPSATKSRSAATSLYGGGVGNSKEPDPFNAYEIFCSPSFPSRDGYVRFLDAINIARENREKSNINISTDLYDRGSSVISSELRARLYGNGPDPTVSHGIYANENNGLKFRLPTSITTNSSGSSRVINNIGKHNDNLSSEGYRIVVSNLHPEVTTADVKELFSEIGAMYDARVVRPGTAEVIYVSLYDAERAVEAYHNRQLDGQPMTCMLVKPRSSNRPTAPAIGSTQMTGDGSEGGAGSAAEGISATSSVSCDIKTLHSVLFGGRFG